MSEKEREMSDAREAWCAATMFSGSLCTRPAGHEGHHFHRDPWAEGSPAPREALVALLHNEGDGGIWEHFDRKNSEAVADAILAAGWTPPRSVAELVTGAAHPEDVCHRCGGPNVVRWHAPSEAWNQVEQREGILCPQCFTSAYEALHPGTAWHVGPEVSGPCRYPLLTNEEPSAPPPLEDVARAILMVTQAADVDPDYAWNVQYPEVQDECLDQARAVLALFPGRAEAEVKAEALREAAQFLRGDMDEPWGDRAANRLDTRADRIARGEGS